MKWSLNAAEDTIANYVTVKLPRTGLGHSLESYSRAFTYYASGVAEFVHPYWFKIRIGPYLRKEMDKRNYHRFIRTPASWGLSPVHNVRRLWNLVVTEATFNPAKDGQFLIVIDEGPHDFSRIQPYKSQFVEALESLSRMPLRPRPPGPTIGIFHRSGDFRGLQPGAHADERTRRTHGYGYIPPEYAADALQRLRDIARWQVPAVLSTDADSSEVECILRLGNISLTRTDSALANMLEMRHHNVLIIGSSSYGRWSYFLGDSFAVFPKLSEREAGEENPLGIPYREGAWFVFPADTALNHAGTAAQVARRLAR